MLISDALVCWAFDLVHEHQMCEELGVEECEHDLEKVALAKKIVDQVYEEG